MGNPQSLEKNRLKARHTRSLVHRSAKLKEAYGTVRKKNKLRCCLLIVDGLTDSSFADVKHVLSSKSPDALIFVSFLRQREGRKMMDLILMWLVTMLLSISGQI